MSTSVLLACDLNEQKVPKFVLIQENSGADASFLVVSLIGSCLKHQQNGVVLVCLHHIGQHYISAAARLGINIGAARDKNRIVFVEPLADIGENFLTSRFVSEAEDKVFDSLYHTIKENAEQQLANNKENVSIVIDNVAMLIDLGYKMDSVRQFCHRLIHIADERISIVLKINTCNLYADLIRSIEDYARSDYHVAKMKSGEFQEVDGKIIYKKRGDNLRHTVKTILFKVGDKNIKIFQPGEIGVRA